ncbi:VLRF1 family aeRF1-type release factor [Anaerorudis cellulosivorans]|uniref:VLRF1 family aeRF1-type release factor n=1 Tax=Anaerorudis cellulosivorans TaxID=3397862 RepID=UPI002220CCAC|nr:VLRF1 family aeRF1-type release factor [Seramator thermalis]MCW1735673.1 VLRF1 family aeRF1-type release factor [Seramator thermalis]
MISKKDIQRFKKIISSVDKPVLSVYCNVNPADPDNFGRAWHGRLKNTLKSMDELKVNLKKGKTFYDELIVFIDQLIVGARTLALFAWVNDKNELEVEHFELQVELPVVDLVRGRVETHFGKPYVLPILYAFDEFYRVGVVHVYGSKWRFYEAFLNEIEEITETFAEITPDEWKEFNEYAQIIESGVLEERTFNDKLKFKDRQKARIQTFSHKLYVRLAQMVEKSVLDLGLDRLILMGNDWEVKLFENHLNRHIRELIIGYVSNPLDTENPSSKDVLERIAPVLREAEEREEMQLIADAQSPKGVCGLQNVLEAIQMARLQVLILPWDLHAKVYKCKDEMIFANPEEAQELDPSYEEVELKKEVFLLAAQYATRIEFVDGAMKEKLYNELQGIAGIVRW